MDLATVYLKRVMVGNPRVDARGQAHVEYYVQTTECVVDII